MSTTTFVPFNESELIAQVRRQAKSIDQCIRRRNWVEYLAGLLVILFFAAVASQTGGPIRLACFGIIAATLWVGYFLKRYGSPTPEPDPRLTLAEFREAMLDKFDRQIWLLKNVKFWYILPLYAAMMAFYAAVLGTVIENRGYLRWLDLAIPIGPTLLCAFIWWLNESYGVRKLHRERESLRQRLGQEREL